MGGLQFVNRYGPTILVHNDGLFVAHHLLFLVEGTTSHHHLDIIIDLLLVRFLKLIALKKVMRDRYATGCNVKILYNVCDN